MSSELTLDQMSILHLSEMMYKQECRIRELEHALEMNRKQAEELSLRLSRHLTSLNHAC